MRGATTFGVLLVCGWGCAPLAAQQTESSATESAVKTETQDVTTRSLPLRTALHHDPSLEAPFERLTAMYRESGRLAELVELYRQHTATYPTDPNGAAVLVRLLEAAGDSQAAAVANTSADAHADNAYLQYLLYQSLRRSRQTDALASLEKALALTKSPRHKAAWTETLLGEAVTSEQPELIDKYLKASAAEAATGDAKLEVAERMLKFSRHEAALAVLAEAAALNSPPETQVRIETTAASAEVALDRTTEAAARLDRLLAKLGPDYWGRADIVRGRISLITNEDERNRLIETAKTRYAERPTDEAAAADLASLLIGFERRREALTVLVEASDKVPASERLEKMTLELLDRLRDEPARRDFLARKLKAFPDRGDLLVLQIKALFAAGDRPEARKHIDRLVTITPQARRSEVQLELARSLLKLNPTSDAAAELFQRVVDAEPNRFDLRRELGELYVKLGNRSRARELFTRDLPADVVVESVLDFVPFLIEQEMFAEARKALRQAVKPDDANLDLRLLLIDVERRTGNRSAASKLLLEARPLADTSARYKLWIDAAATLHEEDETLADFVTAEAERLAAEKREWNDARIERVTSLFEVAGREKAKTDLSSLAAEYTDDDAIPEAVRTKLRRQVVRILGNSKEQNDALADQLQELIDTLPEAADEYRARLALLHMKANNHHLVQGLLNEVRVARIGDVALLTELERAFTQFQQPHQAAAVLERLTALEPAEKKHWEAWLYQLAMTGREDRLRDTLRRLQSGVDGLTLEEPVKELLQAAEIDSYGRSILSHLVDGRVGPMSEALSLLSFAERKIATPQQALWLYWNRSFVLNRLGRSKERDEAIDEMEKIFRGLAAPPVADMAATTKPERPSPAPTTVPEKTATAAPPASVASNFVFEPGDEPRLRFPDGLSLSMANARRLLTSPPYPPSWPKADARNGPLAPLKTGWALDFPANRSIEQLRLASAERLVAVDSGGGITGIDALTGKVLWERLAVIPFGTGSLHMTVSRTVRGAPTSQSLQVTPACATVVADDRNRLYYAARGEVVCLSVVDGELLWRSTIASRYEGGNLAPTTTAPCTVFLHDGDVLAFDPVADVVAAVDCETGRLEWSHDISAGLPAVSTQMHWLNSGATFDGRRMFVYGNRAALVDVATRQVEWTIDPSAADKVPLRLDPAPPATPLPTLPVAYSSPYPTSSAMFLSRPTSPTSSRYVSASLNVGRSPYAPGYASPAPTPYYSPSPTPSVAAPQYVDYQQRSTTAASSSPRSPIDTTLVGPAAKWSSDTAAGQPRFAVLNDNRLLLGSAESSSLLDTDLPIAGRRMSIVGSYVGRVGHLLCCLRGNEMAVVDLANGLRGALRLTTITGGEYNARLQASIDGPLVYITGPQGIYCTNVMSRRRVFTAPWPAGAQQDVDDPNRPPETDHIDTATHYLWNGAAVGVGQTARCVAPTGAVSRGRLYTTVTPWRIVCLQGVDEP